MLKYPAFYLSAFVFVCILSGCAATKKVSKVFSNEFSLPPQRPLLEADITPQARKLSSNPVMVMVNTSRNIDDQLGIEKSLIQSIVRELDAKGMSFRADYTSGSQYLDELVRVVARSSENFQGERAIDYDLHLKLHESSIFSEYEKPGICLFGCDKKRPGNCTFYMKSNLQIEVTGFFPQKKLIQSIDIRERDSYSTEAFNACPRYNQKPELSNNFNKKSRDLRQVLSECAVEYLYDILSPEAYIKNYYSDGETNLFSLTAGANTGLVKGESVIIQEESTLEPGTFFEVAEGKIAHSQGAVAYISISDKNTVANIKRNHRVKLVPKSGLLGKRCSAKVKVL